MWGLWEPSEPRIGSDPACVGLSVQAAEDALTAEDTHPCTGAVLAHRGSEEVLVDEARAEECFDLLDRKVDTAAISTPHIEQSAARPPRDTSEVSSGCIGFDGTAELTLMA